MSPRGFRYVIGAWVVFEEDDAPPLAAQDGIATIKGNYPSKGTGEFGGWFRDCEGNMLGIGQPFRARESEKEEAAAASIGVFASLECAGGFLVPGNLSNYLTSPD